MIPKRVTLQNEEYDDWEYLSVDEVVYKYNIDINEFWSRMTDYLYPVNEPKLINKDNISKILRKDINVQLIFDPYGKEYYLNPLDEVNIHKITLAYMLIYAPIHKEYGIIDWDFIDNIPIVEHKKTKLLLKYYEAVYMQLREQLIKRKENIVYKIQKIENYL